MQVCWSPTRPAVFWAVDTQRNLYIFDMVADRGEPVLITQLSTTTEVSHGQGGVGEGGRVCFSLDPRPQTRNSDSPAMLAILGCSSTPGAVDVHLLPDKYGP